MKLSTCWQLLVLSFLLAPLAQAQSEKTPDRRAVTASVLDLSTANGQFIDTPPVLSFTPGILTEDFASTTFPPTGWARFESGTGTVQQWSRATSTTPGITPAYAQSQYENVATGLAIDWLATPVIAVPAGGAILRFSMWQAFTADFGSSYSILASTGSQTTPGDYTVLATWTEAQACPGGATPQIGIPAGGARNCTLTIPATYNGANVFLAFRHTNDDGDNFNLDNVLVEPVPVTPVFALGSSQSSLGNFGAVGACTVQPTSVGTFTVTNTGAGTLAVNSATITGPNASAFVISGSTLPASLTSGQSTTFTVTAAPGAADNGTLTASLVIAYNNGTAQTSTTALTAAATNANPSAGLEAGYFFGNSTSCNTGATQAGTALIDFSAHTLIGTVGTPWTSGSGEDGFFTVDAAALDALGLGSFKLFGRRYEQLFISSNGGVTFGSGVASFSSFDTTAPTTTGGGAITAYMDLDMRPGNTTAAVPAPGVFYGMDGNNLVVTYAYARFYTDGTSEDSTPWQTFQIILEPALDGDTFNGQDDNAEIRFIGSAVLNGAGQPYSVAAGQRTYAFNQAVGLFNALGTASVSYLSNGFNGEATATEDDLGGAFFTTDGSSVGVRFAPQTQATAGGAAGYRMMGAPVNGYTVGRLADLNLVQGVTGQYPGVGSNLFTFAAGAYVPATDVAQALPPGQGFLWYVYNIDLDPAAGPNPATGGTSQSYTLPMPLQGTGVTPTATVARTLETGFNLVANPFRASLNVAPATVNGWATGGTLTSGIVQIWNPTTSTYVQPTGNVVTAWQGFFIENVSATSLDIPTAAQTTGGTFVGLTDTPPSGVLSFRLSGTDAATGAATTDLAATLAVAEEAQDAWDFYDATKLAPLAQAYATIGFQGAGYDGQPTVKAQESRATDAATFTVPMVIDAVGTAPTLTLSWTGLDVLPEAWGLQLRDVVTGTLVDLRAAGSYTFEQAAGERLALSPEALVARTTTAAQAKAGTAARFELVVTTGNVVAGEGDAPTEFALESARPNPTTSSSTLRFAMLEAGQASVAVYDLLGRRVATLAEGDLAAGWHEATIPASALAPGMYVVRMQTGTFAATQRVTVVR